MSSFYYGIGLFVVLLNIIVLFNHTLIFNTVDWAFKFKKVTKRNPQVKDFTEGLCFNSLLFWSFTVVVSVSWIIIGILSGLWFIYLGLLLSNITFNRLSKLFDRMPNIRRKLMFTKCLILTAVISFLVLNHFHFKIDLISFFQQLIK